MTWVHRGVLSAAVLVLGAATLLVGLDRQGREPALGDGDATETLDEQIARVAHIVAEVRGFSAEPLPEVTILSPGDLVTRVAEDLINYTDEDADRDRRILAALGAVPTDYDLRDELIGSLSQQVAGFYDPTTSELVVGAGDDDRRVGRIEEITLAHELEHALADRELGLPGLDDPDATDDALLAQRALVEGDATLTMQAYTEVGFSDIDRLFLAQEALELQAQLAQVDGLPHHLQRSLTFPYQEGAAFVSALLERGGWDAVDAAYERLPTTTNEILFPDRYPADPAPPLPAPPEPGAPWATAHTTSLGAAEVLFLLEAPGGDPTTPVSRARDVARGVLDGRVDLWTDGADSLVAVALRTDDPERVCQGLTTWVETWRNQVGTPEDDTTTWSDADDAVALRCGPEVIRIGIGPDDAVARSVTVAG